MNQPQQPDPNSLSGAPTFVSEQRGTDFEMEFFGRVLERSPNHADALRVQAELYSRRGDYAKSLPLDRRLAELLPHRCVVRYNLACSLAMTDRLVEAIEQLREAIRLGYDDFAHL